MSSGILLETRVSAMRSAKCRARIFSLKARIEAGRLSTIARRHRASTCVAIVYSQSTGGSLRCPGRLELGVTALLPTKCDLGHTTEDPAVVDGEILLLEIEHPVAPALGLEHQKEGGVLLDVDGPDGVHHEGESERLAGGHFSDSADPPTR